MGTQLKVSECYAQFFFSKQAKQVTEMGLVNAIAKWPYAYRLMYQQNKTVNCNGGNGKQLAGDEWVEDYLVKPVKQFTSAQSSFCLVA